MYSERARHAAHPVGKSGFAISIDFTQRTLAYFWNKKKPPQPGHFAKKAFSGEKVFPFHRKRYSGTSDSGKKPGRRSIHVSQ